MSKLWYLDLYGNLLNRSIPYSLGKIESFYYLSVSKKHLSGKVHVQWTGENLESRNYEGNDSAFDMELVQKGSNYLCGPRMLMLVNIIDLSSNNLSGDISEDITNLLGLATLNVSNNNLAGKIPQKIGDIQYLETLDLSSNHFSGQIPPRMSFLTSLSHLNLLQNNLSGPIPLGKQFPTFDKSIYEGI
ncbi:hypothetical protein LguiA_018392 [Lonicera macranthoides]